MNCRQLNKFLITSKNFKYISTYPETSSDNFHWDLPRISKDQFKSVKFVPTNVAPKLTADKYYESTKQSDISKRILPIRKRTAELNHTNSITHRLENLMRAEKKHSVMNLPIKSQYPKVIFKPNLNNSRSSSRSSFSKRSNALLQKVMTVYGQHAQSKRFGSTKAKLYDEQDDKYETKYYQKLENISAIQTRGALSASRPLIDIGKVQSNVEESLDTALAIKDKLEDLSYRIKDDLRRIDGSLKQKLASIKHKSHKGAAVLSKKETAKSFEPEEFQQSKTSDFELNLIPIDSVSPLEIINEHSRRLDFDPKNSIISRMPHPTGITQLRSGESFLPQNNIRDYKGTTDGVNIKGDLMQVPLRRMMEIRYNSEPQHVLSVETKDAADADGVYFAPKKSRKNQWL